MTHRSIRLAFHEGGQVNIEISDDTSAGWVTRSRRSGIKIGRSIALETLDALGHLDRIADGETERLVQALGSTSTQPGDAH